MFNKISYERVKELYSYNPATGDLVNKKNGKMSRSNNGYGYFRVFIDKRSYLVHRIAWLLTYGYMPECEIDHINRNRCDNRIANLREVSRRCNARNCSVGINNKSGVVGVSFCKTNKKWRATINIDYIQKTLGHHKKKLDAVVARWEGEKKYNFTTCYTTSSAYLYLKERSMA